jgi:exonuclease III
MHGGEESTTDPHGRLITAEFESVTVVLTYVQHPGKGRQCQYRELDWDPAMHDYLQSLLRRNRSAKKGKLLVWMGDLNVSGTDPSNRDLDIGGMLDLSRPNNCMQTHEEYLWPGIDRILSGSTGGGGGKGEGSGEGSGGGCDGGGCLEGADRGSASGATRCLGMVDIFRRLHPTTPGYTYWGKRENDNHTDEEACTRGFVARLDYFIVCPRTAEKAVECRVARRKFGSDHRPVVLMIGEAGSATAHRKSVRRA